MAYTPDIGEPTLRSIAEFYRAFPQNEWLRGLVSLYGGTPLDDAAELFEMNGIDKKSLPSVAREVTAVSQRSTSRATGFFEVAVVQDGNIYPRAEFESGSAKMREQIRDDIQAMAEDLAYAVDQFLLHGTVSGTSVSNAQFGLLDDTAVGTGVGVVGRPVSANTTPGTPETGAGGWTGITRVAFAPLVDMLNAIHRIVTCSDSTRNYRQLVTWAENMLKSVTIDVITNPKLLHRLNWPVWDGAQHIGKTYLEMLRELGIRIWPDPSISATLTDGGTTLMHVILNMRDQARYAEWSGGMRTDGPLLQDQNTSYWIRRAWKGGSAFKSRKIYHPELAADYFLKSHVTINAVGYKST